MKVVKHCKEIHNPLLNITKLKIGTLAHFKEVSDPFIKDVKELEISRLLDAGTGQEMTGNQVGQLSKEPITGNGTFFFKGAAIDSTYSLPNVFAFCTSIKREKNIKSNVSPDYNSHYQIIDLTAFSEFMKIKLMQITGLSFLEEHGPIKYLNIKSVEYKKAADFFFMHKKVDPKFYLMKIKNSVEYPEIDFSENLEYRFVFIPIDYNGRTLPISKEPILIDTDGVEGLIGN